MPKMKTRRSAAKRYTVTGSGKVRFKKQGSRHILTKKSTKRKRSLRQDGFLNHTGVETVKAMMPYSF
ncbi:MAG: 50S ribosomal protein L35 [Sphaerochaetaceae bacterium]